MEACGARHHDYTVTMEQYDRVGGSLIFALGKGLGKDFCPEAAEARISCYNYVSRLMMDAQMKQAAA